MPELDVEIGNSRAVVRFYNKRGTGEQSIKESKLAVKLDPSFVSSVPGNEVLIAPPGALPPNVSIAWSNHRKCTVEANDQNITDWTRGFDAAFRKKDGQAINPSIENAAPRLVIQIEEARR